MLSMACTSLTPFMGIIAPKDVHAQILSLDPYRSARTIALDPNSFYVMH